MRIAVTGCSSDFGTVILPRLFDDEDVTEIVGLDLRRPRVDHPKLTFHEADVRSSKVPELFEGCDAVVHLAFVVAEIHDKELTHDVNLGGSRNVIEAASATGVRRLVLASSVAAYGMHQDNPVPATEAQFPRGNHDKYYFYDKAEVEHFVTWWQREHPDAEMTITLLRPVVICGPHFTNGLLEQGSRKRMVLPDGAVGFQWLYETDLADAFVRVLKEDHPGPFNVAPDDPAVPLEELGALHGQRITRVPVKAAAIGAEALFRLRLSPVSADWVGSGEIQADNSKLKHETGWAPKFSGREAASIHLLQRGRPALQPLPLLHRHDVAEAALAVSTEALTQWGFGSALDDLSHEWLPFRSGELHLEVHEAGADAEATVIFSPGIGGHARFYTPVLAALREAGFNAIGLDRPGHGLSTGRRGDSPMEVTLDAVEAAVGWARERFGAPVALAGSSLGGVTSWYALTREPDIACAVCHNIIHPESRIDRKAELLIPAMKRLSKVLPLAPARIKDFADFGEVASDPRILDYFESERDRLWNWTITMRTGASFFDFKPQLPWELVTTPVLVMVGESDGMLTPDFTRDAFGLATPPTAELREVRGGHMLFLENLAESVEQVAGFVREHAAAAVPA